MYYCKDNNVNYYNYHSKSKFGIYKKYKNIDFWKLLTDIILNLFAIVLLAFFLIFGYLYMTKQGSIVSEQIRYVLYANPDFQTTKFPTYLVKSQKILLEKREVARVDKFLTDNSQREKSKKIVLKKVKALDNVRTIVVKKNDTLYTLAEKAYGNASYYKLIFDANPKVLKTEKDLYIGQTLRIPF